MSYNISESTEKIFQNILNENMTSEENADSAARAHHVSGYNSAPLWARCNSKSLYDYDPEEGLEELRDFFKASAKKARQERRQKLKNLFFGPAKDIEDQLIEGRVFPHSNGFGLSLYDDDDYEPTTISKVRYYPFSVEDDGEKYYFDKHGNSVKNIWNAIYFETKEEALDFGNKYLIFGELDVEEVTKTEQVILEAIDDFPKNTRAMYRFAKRKHDDTKAIRKVSKEPYWVHPEGVAKIVMEHGGSDVEIKAAMAHDTMEDAGVDYNDMEEKFGEKVASIVKEVTNDKYEIARVGKEKYISEELCRLSPEALTVKLADMLYNMKDSPTESNYERMRKNIAFLMMNRQLDGVHLALAEEILEV